MERIQRETKSKAASVLQHDRFFPVPLPPSTTRESGMVGPMGGVTEKGEKERDVSESDMRSGGEKELDTLQCTGAAITTWSGS